MRRVLVVDDEENLRVVLRTFLKRNGYEVEVADNGEVALEMVESFGPDFILTDVRMPKMGGLDLLGTLKAKGNEATVIVMSAYGNVDLALEAMQAGAYDYVQKPFKNDEVLLALKKAEERENLKRENRALKAKVLEESVYEDMLAQSEAMQNIFRTINKVADFKTTALITGESGVGKELVARALHHRSSRKDNPFVAVNCGAIPENLLESELFGHKRGAFTDAQADRAGLFEQADGGTLFLDEIGELPLALQVKLLRVLQDETVRRLGDNNDLVVDVRITAATHRDLTAEVKAGRFREDLFYRINVLHVHVPPLRDRRDDIPLLIDHFIERNNRRLGTTIRGMTPEARKLMMTYGWPGNVRELENTIERAMVLADEETLVETDLPDRIHQARDPIRMQLASGELSIKKTQRVIEEVLIRRALTQTKGNRTRASQLLEISHRALLYKIKDYDVELLMPSADAIEIRAASDADSEALCTLIADIFAEYEGVLFILDEMPELRAIATAFIRTGGEFWVAERSGEIVGCVGHSPAKEGHGIELKKLYVHRDLRRHGLGARLVDRVEAAARERGAEFVDLWSDVKFETAHRFYERRGYRRDGRTRELHDESDTVEFHFRKDMAP